MDVQRLRLLSINPLVGRIDKFITPRASLDLIRAGADRLGAATVVHGEREGAMPETRSNRSTRIEADSRTEIAALRDRIAQLLNLPPSGCPAMQLLHYSEGERFTPHHDAFLFSKDKMPERLQEDGQRYFTALIYLNEGFSGGDTIFPRLRIGIRPMRGRLVIWSTTRLGGNMPHPDALHEGTVVTSGEKWVATFWFRHPPNPDPVMLTPG